MFSTPHPPPGPTPDDALTTDLDDSIISPPGPGTSASEVTEDLSRSGQVDSGENATDESVSVNEAFILLSKEHEELLKQNTKLNSLLDAERLKNLQLENQLALG